MAERQFQYGIGVDDKGSLVFNKFKKLVADGNREIEASTQRVIQGTKRHGEETNRLSEFIRKQRSEQREQNFLMRQGKDVIGAASVGLGLFSNTAGQSDETMKKLTNSLNQGFVTFQGLDFLLAAVPGPWGVAAAAIGGVAASLLSMGKESEEAQKKIHALKLEAIDLDIKLGRVGQEAKGVELKKEWDNQAAALKKLRDGYFETRSMIDSFTGLENEFQVFVKGTNEEIKEQKKVVDKSAAAWHAWNQSVDAAGAEGAAAAAELRKMQDENAEGSLTLLNYYKKLDEELIGSLDPSTKEYTDTLAHLAVVSLQIEKVTSSMNYQLEQTRLKMLGIGDTTRQTLQNILSNPLIDKLPKMFELPSSSLRLEAKLPIGDIEKLNVAVNSGAENLDRMKLSLVSVGEEGAKSLQNLLSKGEKLPEIFKLPDMDMTLNLGPQLETVTGLKNQIALTERELEQAGLDTQDWLDKFDKLNALKAKLEAALQTPLEKASQKMQLMSSIVGRGLGIIGQLQSQNSQAAIENLETEKNLAIANIDEKLKAENLSAEQKKKLEAEKAAIALQYDGRIRAAKQEAFAAEKAANIIKAIMNTAVEITKVTATPWMIPIVAGLGAAETAVIASQPVPKFHEGGVVPGIPGREIPILALPGETIRTEPQEAKLQDTVIQIRKFRERSSDIESQVQSLRTSSSNPAGREIRDAIASFDRSIQELVRKIDAVLTRPGAGLPEVTKVINEFHFTGNNIASKAAFKEIVQEGMREMGVTDVNDFFKNNRARVAILG